jgi:hypothetical protein
MGILLRITPDDLYRAVGGTAIHDNVFDIGAALLDHVQNAELDETDPVKDGGYD